MSPVKLKFAARPHSSRPEAATTATTNRTLRRPTDLEPVPPDDAELLARLGPARFFLFLPSRYKTSALLERRLPARPVPPTSPVRTLFTDFLRLAFPVLLRLFSPISLCILPVVTVNLQVLAVRSPHTEFLLGYPDNPTRARKLRDLEV